MGDRNAYGEFAKYYDHLGWNRFARNAAGRLEAFFKLRAIKPSNILDLACGTGELEKALRLSRIEFTGVDASTGMLKVARRKCPGTRFVLADVADVRFKRRFDMAVFLFDAANHMNSYPHLARVFKNARRHLRDGGLFIFDVLTEIGVERCEEIEIRRGSDYLVITNGYYYPDKMEADIFIEAFVRKGRLYDRVYQKVVSRVFHPADIMDGLTLAGFEKIIVTPFDPALEIEEAERLWFVCS